MHNASMLNGRGKLPYFPRGIWIVIVGSLLSYGVCAQNSADGSSSNAVCTKAGWKVSWDTKDVMILHVCEFTHI